MPRQPRTPSGTGVYHVMLRGINRQDIFIDNEDYVRMQSCMQQMLELNLCLARRRKTIVNPQKAGIVNRVGDYPWSSWGEYTDDVPAAFSLCATNPKRKTKRDDP